LNWRSLPPGGPDETLAHLRRAHLSFKNQKKTTRRIPKGVPLRRLTRQLATRIGRAALCRVFRIAKIKYEIVLALDIF
jgi:hypothetical protein